MWTSLACDAPLIALRVMENMDESVSLVAEGTAFELAVHRMMAEFVKTPTLRLTAPQAARLVAIDTQLCTTVLETLVEARLLDRTRGSLFLAGVGLRSPG